MMKKIWIIGLLALLLLGGVAYHFMTPKGAINMHKAEALYSLHASELFMEYLNDEAASDEKYSGKIVEVSGALKRVEQGEDGTFHLWLDTRTDEGQIECNMCTINTHNLSQFNIGQEVQVKGICTGYLFDVVIDQAIIQSKK